MGFRRAGLVGLCLCTFLSAKQPITESDLLKIARVTEVQVTRDGSFAIYGVQTVHTDPPAAPNADPAYNYRVNLWSIDLRDPQANPVQLTFGDRSDSGLAISPDGRFLAFVRADSKKHPQIWLMPLTGPGEPRMITDLDNGATSPHWRYDSKALLATSAVPVNKLPGRPEYSLERPGRGWWDFDRDKKDEAEPGSPDGDLREIRDWLEHNAEHNDPNDITRIAFLGELSLNSEISVNELYRVDLSPAGVTKTVKLTDNFRNHNAAVYSPSGNRILFATEPDAKLHPDRSQGRSAVWEMNADGTQEHALLNDANYDFFAPQFTPDGRHLLVLGLRSDAPTYRQTQIARCDADGSHLVWLTNDTDPGAQRVEIENNGSFYFNQNYHGGQRLMKLNDDGAARIVIDAPAGVPVFAVGGGKLVYSQITPANPNELFLAGGRQLTSLNSEWLKDKEISLPEEHWIARPNGMRVQYWIMRPANAQTSEKYPWVLDMHGGPSAMWGPGEFTMWHEFQIFCAFGYGVVYSNPRGSSGYGFDFERANYKDWGDGPMSDVMAALDDAAAKEPMIDQNRLFLTGGSYAGYLTAWMVGHTDRFKAAAALRGVYDLATFFGEGNAYRLVPDEFGGFPWDPETKKLLDKESPITYVSNIKTPLLIIHGSADNRTGIVQGQMLFRALKQMNKPVEYIRYPGAGHEISRSGPPRQRMDHMLRIIEFFERYADNPRTASQSGKTGVQ